MPVQLHLSGVVGRCQISLIRSRVSGCHATLPWNVTRRFCGIKGAADYQTGHPSRAESIWLEEVFSLIWQKLCVPFADWPINRPDKWKRHRAHYEFILTASSREGKSCCQNRWSGRWNRWIEISASKIEGQSWSGGEGTFSNLKIEISLKLTPSLAFQTVFRHSSICKCLWRMLAEVVDQKASFVFSRLQWNEYRIREADAAGIFSNGY